MGQSKRHRNGLGLCIYCRSTDSLTDEHVLPYGMGGQLVLKQSSCIECSRVTGPLEQRLLRGHWWPYRKKLGLQSRNPSAADELKPVKVTTAKGNVLHAALPLIHFVAAIVFELPAPSILKDELTSGEPLGHAYVKLLGSLPKEVQVDGKPYRLLHSDTVEFPVKLDVGDVTRFLAKVAHGYAIHKEGLDAFEEFYLPEFILGKTDGIQTYVGGYALGSIKTTLPGGGHNRMMILKRGNYLSVCVQLFIDNGEPPPIYEIVVGKRRIAN